MKQYQVTGMSCAACSARVEKAVSKVPGVTSCSVSLLTNSMGVEGSAGEQAVIAASQYLNAMPFSRQGLIDQLEFEGFTHEQAVYGVTQNGY